MTINSFYDSQNRLGLLSTDPTEQTFLSVEGKKESLLQSLDSTLSASVGFELSDHSRTYERQAYTFF